MLEIEMKFRLDNPVTLREHLSRCQAQASGTRIEADHYFNAPDRDFAQTGEALRIRCVDQQGALTYKGPKQPGDVKTRVEIEIPLASGQSTIDDMARMLTMLHYRPVAVVTKRREMYELARDGFVVVVCLDQIDCLGDFAEIEILAGDAEVTRAQAVVRSLAAELGLTQLEPRSYLRMVLAT